MSSYKNLIERLRDEIRAYHAVHPNARPLCTVIGGEIVKLDEPACVDHVDWLVRTVLKIHYQDRDKSMHATPPITGFFEEVE